MTEAMVTPEISEFSYGFALTNELVGWTALQAAPIFPSLIEEGKASGGYDVRLDLPGAPLFLQFKRADCMMRLAAREISKHGLDLKVPFFRFGITERKRSFQHTSLVALDDGQNLVFYAAPRFHTLAQINSAWTAKTVVQRSIFVAPQQIGLIADDDRHVIAYDARRTYFCSEPRELTPLSIGDLRQKIESKLDHAAELTLRTQLEGWRENLRDAAARAHEMQMEVEAAILAGREDIIGVTAPEIRAYLEPEQLTFETEGVPLSPMEIRPSRDLGPEAALLRDLSDEARRRFNAQFYVVQRHPPIQPK